MSVEVKRMHAYYGGPGVPKMDDGGVTASLQSMGALGYIMPAAGIALHNALRQVNKVRHGVPRAVM